MAHWQPKLSSARAKPIYRRLVEAIAADIAAGKLAPNTRLPAQRDLAHALSISVGAVTRAYDDAARRGLLSAHVGRGTFVVDRASADAAANSPIDLSINTAPMVPVDAMIETVTALRRASWMERIGYQPAAGLDADRRAGAAWLARTAGFEDLDWRTLLCCSGAQNAMAIAFGALCKPGDAILCETVTFSGAKSLAAQQGYRLHGVEMDAQGIRPQALDRAAASTGARVLYCLPTLQNPTARTMGKARRAEIAKIARARDLWIVEDDVYAPYAHGLGLPPIAALLPERTLYISSLSKILSPGLRSGFLVAPAGHIFERCVRALRAFIHSPTGIGTAVATAWIESGRGDELARKVREEAAARTILALATLKDAVDRPQTEASLHLWMPMPPIEAERVAARALTAGLRLTPPGAFATSGGKAASGLRLCIGSAVNRPTLERALAVLKGALQGEAGNHADAL